MEDLRGWIEHMRGRGLVKDVAGASWDLEVGAITDLNAKRGKWVLLFDQIQDHDPGYRVVTGTLLDAYRVAYTLNCDTGTDQMALVRELRARLYDPARAPRPGAAAASAGAAGSDAPVFEHQFSGGEVDLQRFPAPLWHEHDGGRYLGTLDAVVTRDPDDGWVNLGAYRMTVHGPARLGLFVNASHHGRMHLEKHERRGERTPVAVSLGHHPALSALAGMELPTGVSEYDVVEQLRGEPCDLVRAPVTGLPVPAHSEIVIEGYVAEEGAAEGPYGEFLGYYAGNKVISPVVEVAAVYHRTDPILLGTCSGIPPYDYSYFRCPIRSAMLWESLERAGVPGVAGVWCHEAGFSRALNVVSIRQAYSGHAMQAGLLASQVREAAFGGKYTIVVDDDVDPANLAQVMWAVCTRTDPVHAIEFVRDGWGMALDPMIERGPDQALNELSMSRAIINACRPLRRLARDQFPRVVTVPGAVAERVTGRYPELFG